MGQDNLSLMFRGPANPSYGGVSVIFIVYNESFIIEQTLRNYISELSGRIDDVEFIVCEDGSTDDTKAVLERLERELPIRLYMSNKRKGYQQAVKDALKHSIKSWLFVVDSDYQFAAIDFWQLEPLRGQNDIVMGIKEIRRDPLYRIILSKGLNFLLRKLFNVSYKDMDTGYRLYKKNVVDSLSENVCCMSFFNAEFVVRAHYKGYRIVEIPVQHYARKIGSTNIFYISHLFIICYYQFIGMVKLWIELKQSNKG